jgi:putative ABC transport system ATP-binding protein
MIEAAGLNKTFRSDGTETHALRDVSLTIRDGEFVSIVGRSGSGKTTLLNVLSTLMSPDSGTIRFDGRETVSMSERDLNSLRKKDLAMVFQFHYLLPYLTAVENVLLPFMSAMLPVGRDRTDHAARCLARVGLKGKENRLPGQLSGGEQQRVAIARALVTSAKVLFADEPTGSLDKTTGREIMELIRGFTDDGLAVVMVTHDRDYAGVADRVISMEDGRIVA